MPTPDEESFVPPADADLGAGPGGEAASPEPSQPDGVTLLRQAETECERLRDRLLRAQADHENYVKRVKKLQKDWEWEGIRRLATDLLTVADHMDMALSSTADSADPEKVLEGVNMVRDELLKVLGDHGVKPIDAEGRRFDPAYHEALMQDVTREHPEGTVTGEIRKGYTLKDRLLRASRVRVAAAPPAEEPDDAAAGGAGSG